MKKQYRILQSKYKGRPIGELGAIVTMHHTTGESLTQKGIVEEHQTIFEPYFKSEGLKVVFLSQKDNAGSGLHIAKALQAVGIQSCFISVRQTSFGAENGIIIDTQNRNKIKSIINEADILHFKGDYLQWHGVFKEYEIKKPIVHTFGGSGFRRKEEHLLHSDTCLQWHSIDEYKGKKTAISPDLCYPFHNIDWLPHAYPESPYMWTEPKDVIRIGHSPSHRGKKGTDTIVIPAIEKLKSKGFNVELVLIEGVSNRECIEIKQSCHLFFDQAVIPAYGMSAVEAISVGIPLITYLPEFVRKRDDRMRDCPIICLEEPSIKEAVKVISKALKKKLSLLSEKTYDYAKIHSYKSVGEQLQNLYTFVK